MLQKLAAEIHSGFNTFKDSMFEGADMETSWHEAQDALRKEMDALREEINKQREIIQSLQNVANDVASRIPSERSFVESRSPTEQRAVSLAATRA